MGDRQEVRHPDREAEIARLERLAHWMDDRFTIPGTNIRYGFDALIGLIPGVGDTGAALFSAYMIARARALGVPRRHLWRMSANVLVDLIVGSIPLVGDLFDVGFKANRRNVEILRRHAP